MGACPAAGQVLGEVPAYTTWALSEVPNAQAIRARIWSPRLSEDYVPQGVAAGDGYLWVAA
jgi:hypothetical protein